MSRVLLVVSMALTLVVGLPTQAAEPAAATGRYSATVSVAGTSDAQRDAAIAHALAAVLGRVAPGFSADAEVRAAASSYVRDFRYRRASSGNGLQLQVDFDPGAVDRLVASSQESAIAAGVASAGTSAVTVSSSGTGYLWIGGIPDSKTFAAALAAVRDNDQLRDVIPVAAAQGGLLLQVDFDRPLAGIVAGLTHPGGHLAPAADPHPGANASLRWVP